MVCNGGLPQRADAERPEASQQRSGALTRSPDRPTDRLTETSPAIDRVVARNDRREICAAPLRDRCVRDFLAHATES